MGSTQKDHFFNQELIASTGQLWKPYLWGGQFWGKADVETQKFFSLKLPVSLWKWMFWKTEDDPFLLGFRPIFRCDSVSFREGVCPLDPCDGGLKICLKYKAPRFLCPFSTRLKTAGGKATWPMTSPGEAFKKYSPLVIFTEWLYITSMSTHKYQKHPKA